MKKKNFKVTTNVPDPEVFHQDSELSLFDQNNPDIGFMNLVNEEQIRLSGSKIKFYRFVQTKEYDDVYMEQRNKPISTQPIIVFGHYDPKAVEENLTQFGIELTNDQLFTFNKSYIDRKIGRSPIAGDILEPFFQKIRYEVIEVQEDSFEAYGVYHYVCTAKVLRDYKEIQGQTLTDTSDPVGGVDDRDEIV